MAQRILAVLLGERPDEVNVEKVVEAPHGKASTGLSKHKGLASHGARLYLSKVDVSKSKD